MTRNYILYQESVKMPNNEIGINSFYYDCVNAPAAGIFPLHWHKHLEIISVQSGWLDIEIERVTYRIEAGGIAVINPSQLHACTSFNPASTLFCLMVDMDIFRSRFVESLEEQFIAPLTEGQVLFSQALTDRPELDSLIRACYDAFTQRPPAYQLRLKAILFQLLYVMFTSCIQSSSVKPALSLSSTSRERVNAILLYVGAHYAERIKLDDLVELVHINKYYICKIFQQCVGRTFLEYVNLVRIQKATEMLVSTNKSITDIAFASGFQDINYFSRIFKRIMGISPTALRNRQRQASDSAGDGQG